MDIVDGIVVGAAAAAIGTVLAFKYLNRTPQGGGAPEQGWQMFPAAVGGRPLRVTDPTKLVDTQQGLLAQNSPITEAAYNAYPVTYAPGFGQHTNRPAEEAILPI